MRRKLTTPAPPRAGCEWSALLGETKRVTNAASASFAQILDYRRSCSRQIDEQGV
jgi:hypothetical protein